MKIAELSAGDVFDFSPRSDHYDDGPFEVIEASTRRGEPEQALVHCRTAEDRAVVYDLPATTGVERLPHGAS